MSAYKTIYTDGYDNEWSVSYTADGKYEDAGPVGESGYSYGSVPEITIISIALCSTAIPLGHLSSAFLSALHDHCSDDHIEQDHAAREYARDEAADLRRDCALDRRDAL